MKMKTTQSQIEAKIQEIRESTKYSNAFIKNREDSNDLEWMTRELKNSQLIYKVMAIPTALFCAFLIIYTIGMVLEIFKTRNIDTTISGMLFISLFSLIIHFFRLRLKIEKLKFGVFLLEVKEG